MTVTYDSENLWFVLTNLKGSIWPRVLPYCITNVALTAIIWFLRRADIYDLTFSAGGAGGILNVVVSFFVVTEVNINYGRFWEARGHLGKGCSAARKLSVLVKTMTGRETHAKAREWRGIVKDRLLRLVKESLYDIQSGHIAHTAFRGETSDANAEAEKTERTLLIHGSQDYPEHILFYDKYDLSASLQAALLGNKQFLEKPLAELQIISLLNLMNTFVECYQNLAKFSITPIPFPFVQMGRTLLLLWLYHLPFVAQNGLSLDVKYLFPLLLLIFVITFAFMGLASVSIELSDPLGTDENDLGAQRNSNILVLSIKHDLEEDCDNLFDWTAQRGGVTPRARGFIAH